MLRPFFPFYGSKWRTARRYPAPVGPVCEPFAGSAGYASWYEPAAVELVDADPIIVGVWEYLIATPAAELLRLPDLDPGQSVDELALPQEARWLIGFWLNRGSPTPKKHHTAWAARNGKENNVWGAAVRQRLASQVDRIRHWRVRLGTYWSATRTAGTWFVDPPYADRGRFYRYHDVNYSTLAAWCQRLPGRVIVCEQAGANWLPFRWFVNAKSQRGHSRELIYTNAGQLELSA